MPNKHAQKSEASRARIVDAAHDLFLAQGYHATSMRQIAAQAELTTGGVYAQFPAKQEIWVAVFLERHPYLTVLPELAKARGETVEEFIGDAARRMLQGLGEDVDLMKLMFIEVIEFQGRHMELLFSRMAPNVVAIFGQLMQRRGSLRHVSPAALARSFFGLFFSYYITQIFAASVADQSGLSATLDEFVDIYLHGILAPTPPPEAA